MGEVEHDPVIARALADIAVPAATDEFWAALEQQLVAVDAGDASAAPVPPVAGTSVPVPELAEPVRELATVRRSTARRGAWRVVAVAATLALLVVGIATLARRGSAPVETGPVATAPPVGRSPIDTLAAYKDALDRKDRATAEQLLGPRTTAQRQPGDPVPFEISRVGTVEEQLARDPNGGTSQVVWADDWYHRATVIPVTEDATAIVIPMDGISTFPDGRVVRLASAPDEAVLLWRGAAEQPWLIEESPALAPVGFEQIGLEQGNGVTGRYRIPGAGHSWVFVDGVLHADHAWTAADTWTVRGVAATSATTAPAREVVSVFIGGDVATASVVSLGGERGETCEKLPEAPGC